MTPRARYGNSIGMLMGELELYTELKNADEDKRLKLLAHAIEESKRLPDLSAFATKKDLDLAISLLELRLSQKYNLNSVIVGALVILSGVAQYFLRR